MEHFYQRIKGWFRWEELYKRAVQLAPPNAQFVEIGCHAGRSTSFLAVEAINSRKNIKIHAVDIWDESSKFGLSVDVFLKNIAPVSGTVMAMQSDSTLAAQFFEDESVDFVWVDGYHRYPKPLQDIQAWWPKLKNGGWMGGDDLIHGGVRRSAEEFFGPECDRASGNGQGNWVRYQDATVYLWNEGKKGPRPADGGWVWWARAKSADWTPPGLLVKGE